MPLRFKKNASILIMLLCASVIPQKPITIYMIGDSTMANKLPGAYPETGWGMAFGQFFDTSVTIDNRALNGRSTLSFQGSPR